MKKLALIAVVFLSACSGGGPTAPEPVTPATTVVEPTNTVSTPLAVVPPVVTPDGWDVKFKAYAGFEVKNTGGTARTVYAYTTSFDNQSKATASKVEKVGPGGVFAYGFNKYCVQLDLSTEAVEGRPDVGFAFYAKDGTVITPANRDEKIAECRRGTPTPAPTPTPETSPSPEPTPVPTPSPSPTPEADPDPEPTPTPTPSPTPTPAPTCEQLNPTSYYSDQTQNFNFDQSGNDRGELNSANVHVKVWNKDNWKLEIWASTTKSTVDSLSERQTVNEDTSGDQQVRIKGSDSDTPTCGKHKELIVNINQHSWKYWFFRIYRNGSIVFTSDLFFLP